MCHILKITNPFVDEVGRHLLNTEAEQIIHLCRENRQGDTAGKTNNHWVWHKFDDVSQFKHTYQNQDYSSHNCGYHQTAKSMLLDNSVNNNDKRSSRTADLHLAAS